MPLVPLSLVACRSFVQFQCDAKHVELPWLVSPQIVTDVTLQPGR
ncbi:MAG: hypothetical protein WCA16_13010 [Candidatus Sulfotelmatobacter sp.]